MGYFLQGVASWFLNEKKGTFSIEDVGEFGAFIDNFLQLKGLGKLMFGFVDGLNSRNIVAIHDLYNIGNKKHMKQFLL